MQLQRTRRKAQRVPASFIAYCRQADLNEVATKVFNLSMGGIGIKTNYPISAKERLAVAFHIPDTTNMVSVTGEVAWRKFHRDAPKMEEPLYTAGIKFSNLEEPSSSFISAYIESGGEVMNQRDKIDTLEADFEVDFSDEEGYSARRKNKGNGFVGKPPGKSGFSLLIGAVILGLFVLVAVLFQRSSNIDSGNRMRSLERRIKQLEERLYTLDRIEANLEQIEEKTKHFNSFMDISRSLEKPSKRSTAQTSEKQTKAVYHEVVAGETLYSISRRRGLTVEELRRLNQLKSGEIIHPKQRLLVRPAGNQ
jgi:LysM repeat protein